MIAQSPSISQNTIKYNTECLLKYYLHQIGDQNDKIIKQLNYKLNPTFLI